MKRKGGENHSLPSVRVIKRQSFIQVRQAFTTSEGTHSLTPMISNPRIIYAQHLMNSIHAGLWLLLWDSSTPSLKEYHHTQEKKHMYFILHPLLGPVVMLWGGSIHSSITLSWSYFPYTSICNSQVIIWWLLEKLLTFPHFRFSLRELDWLAQH